MGLNNTCAIRRNNSIPIALKSASKEEIASEIKKDIDVMRSNNIGRIAIITKNERQTIELYDKLKDSYNSISVISQGKNPVIGEISLLPSYISKGLEFDGVIAYTDEFEEYKEKDRHLFYVVCTRAQNSLTVYNQKTLKLTGPGHEK